MQPNTAPDTAELQRKKTFDRNKWLFSTGGIGRDMSYQLIATFLLVYIQFAIPLTLAQFTTLSLIIGVGGRIWDAVNDPIMGAIIEGTHMKWGKFKPWILIGAVSCGLVIITMFNVQSISGWNFVVFMSIMYLLWESTFTMNDIGYWAMLPSLSSKKEERNQVTMLTVLFAGIGAIIAQGIVNPLTVGDMRSGYRFVSILIGCAFIGCQIMTAVGVKETPRAKVEKSEKISLKKMWQTIMRNDQILWMTLSMLFYSIGSVLLTAMAANLLYMEVSYNGTLYFYLVVAYGVTSVLVNVLYPSVVAKLGRKKLQNLSIGIACFGYICIALMGWTSLLPFNIWLLCGFAALISCGQSLFYMASIVNMTNCVEYNDYKHGERNEAVVSTLRPFMAKFGAAIQTLIVTIVLAASGVFLLSQSISTLETQKSFFDKMSSTTAQQYYIEQLQGYIEQLDGLDTDSAEYAAAVKSVNNAILADDVMATYQLDPEYVLPLANSVVVLKAYDSNGTAVAEADIALGRLAEIDTAQIVSSQGGYTYKAVLEVGDVAGAGESAANLAFRDRSSLSMRLWLRAAVTILPIILLLLALYVQNKKFVIDEKYYDMMLEEIGKREQN